MIKFKANEKGNKKVVIGLGITQENVNKLKQGMPILVRGDSLEIPCDILIFYGENEKECYLTVEEFIGKDTEFRYD